MYVFYIKLRPEIVHHIAQSTRYKANYSFFPSFQVNEGSQLLLSACLSCDGCLSDDENVKISQQSLEEVKHVLALNKVRKHTVIYKKKVHHV